VKKAKEVGKEKLESLKWEEVRRADANFVVEETV
jgi:hypothetical protein